MSVPVIAETAAYLPSVRAVVTGLPTLKGTPASSLPGARPTEPILKRADSAGDELITFWGENNDYPQKIIELASKSTIIPQALADKAALWVAGGVMATKDRNSEEEIDDEEIYQFLNDTTFESYLLQCALDVGWFWNAFPELVISRDRKRINQIHCNEAAYCRWGRQNPTTGALDSVYINANWQTSNARDKETQKFFAIDPYRSDRVEQLRAGKDFKVIYPLSFPSPGKTFYQLAPWDATRASGWLDYLFAIPQFKKYGMQNKMSIRYHIEVPAGYWEKVYKDRWGKSDAENDKIRNEFLDSITEKLTDVQNANKTIMTETWLDHNGEEHSIKINVLDDKEKDNKYNEDYSDGQAELLYALGTDPSMFGYQSKDIQRSGGSDKRQSFDIFIAKSGPYRGRILEPLKFIAEYNGWKQRYPRLTFKFRDTLLTTLDTGAPTKPNNTAA